jgi:pimeloyl-ACP methyl ester carboxylesterase
MMRLQADGVYPRAFETIRVPVIMLHGSVDPHPGQMIRASLEPHLGQLEYVEWERCGHYPWLEPAARDDFFRRLVEWIHQTADRSDATRTQTATAGFNRSTARAN